MSFADYNFAPTHDEITEQRRESIREYLLALINAANSAAFKYDHVSEDMAGVVKERDKHIRQHERLHNAASADITTFRLVGVWVPAFLILWDLCFLGADAKGMVESWTGIMLFGWVAFFTVPLLLVFAEMGIARLKHITGKALAEAKKTARWWSFQPYNMWRFAAILAFVMIGGWILTINWNNQMLADSLSQAELTELTAGLDLTAEEEAMLYGEGGAPEWLRVLGFFFFSFVSITMHGVVLFAGPAAYHGQSWFGYRNKLRRLDRKLRDYRSQKANLVIEVGKSASLYRDKVEVTMHRDPEMIIPKPRFSDRAMTILQEFLSKNSEQGGFSPGSQAPPADTEPPTGGAPGGNGKAYEYSIS